MPSIFQISPVTQGVAYDPVRHLDQFGMWVLVLRDPDLIPLELITY